MAKDPLDVAIRPTVEPWTVDNDEAGITPLVTQLQTVAPTLVVLEATGGFQGAVPAALAAAGRPVVVVNPRQVRAFARAVGILAKTDRIDARVIAHCAEAVRPTPRPLPTAETQELRALLGRRRQRSEMLTAEGNRLASAPPSIRDAIQQHSPWRGCQSKGLDDALAQRIQASAVWQAKDEGLRSIPGVGPVLARTMLGQVPELGTLDATPIAALVGVAPFHRDSGPLRGRRTVYGGRAEVRAGLYRGALVATKHHPVIKAFYERLCAAGKAKKVALTACRHTLLTIMNARVRDLKPWQPQEGPIA